jgi:Amt family ammonium transporter
LLQLQQLFLVLLLRTKFTTYLIFSLLMTLLIYPISGSWVWNAGGWLAKMGFTDFAGSSVVHSVGGWASLVAAALVGPELESIILTGLKCNTWTQFNVRCLRVFILWFGWFGFNPGSQLAISGDNAFKVAAILSQQILLELLEHWLQCS